MAEDLNRDQDEIKKFLSEKEVGNAEPKFTPLSETDIQPLIPKVKTYKSQEEVDEIRDLANQTGWKKLPLNQLPSGGQFYPDGTEMMIKAAEVAEIRHWSTIDENDAFGMDDHFNFVASKCLRIKMPGKIASYKDLKEEDRFYIIFSIRDLTFKEGENKMFVTLTCTCDEAASEKLELKNDNFNFYNIDEKIMRFFSPEEKCFILDNPAKLGNGIVRIYVPSLGIADAIKKHIRGKAQRGEKIDPSFLKIIPFIISDWRILTGSDEDIDKKLKALEQESFGWSPKKLSAVITLIEGIRFGTKLEITKNCKKCDKEVSTPIQFLGGVKSIFVISNILDELF